RVGRDRDVHRATNARELTRVALVEERLALEVAEGEEVGDALASDRLERVLAEVEELGRDEVLERAAVRELGEAALGGVARVGKLGVVARRLLGDARAARIERRQRGRARRDQPAGEPLRLALVGAPVLELREVLGAERGAVAGPRDQRRERGAELLEMRALL